MTGGPYRIATAELLLSKDASGKKNRRRLYWKVDWCAPFPGQSASKAKSASPSTGTSSASANPASTAENSEPQQKAASTDSNNDQDTCSSSTEEVLEFVGSAFYVGYTHDKKKASNFYLKPIVQSMSKGDKYFHIATDPDDSQTQADCEKKMSTDQNPLPTGGISSDSRERKVAESGSEFEVQQQDPPGPQNASQSDTNQVDSDSQNALAPIESGSPNTAAPIESNSSNTPASAGEDVLDELEPQRYVSVVDDRLVAGLNLKHLKKGSVFKLKHLHEDVTQPLSQCQWLPEALRGSQPHILCRQGNSLRSKFIMGKLMSVYINMEEDHEKKLISYGKHVEGDKRYSYFILEKGHN
jgi:hypothetical protein